MKVGIELGDIGEFIQAGCENATVPKLVIKHPGAFTKYCEDNGYKGVTCGCICKALKTDDKKLKKQARFAYQFGFKKNKKTCKCVEDLK